MLQPPALKGNLLKDLDFKSMKVPKGPLALGGPSYEQTPNGILLSICENNEFEKSFQAKNTSQSAAFVPPLQDNSVGILLEVVKDDIASPSIVEQWNLKPDSLKRKSSELDIGIEKENQKRSKDVDDKQRQLFLEKNRQAAIKCRQKKKNYIMGLEETVAKLTAENEQLKASFQQVQNELALLRSQAGLN